jgi:hypothetical protein
MRDNLDLALLYSEPFHYSDDMVLHPITMKDILDFNLLKASITVRKNSIFPIKKILKMSYLEFLFYCHNNTELAEEFKMPLLPYYYTFAFKLLQLVFKDQDVKANPMIGGFMVNGTEISHEQFDDFRRIIIAQNGIDFDIDEFIHRDTQEALEKAQAAIATKEKYTLEDYIDSVCLAMGLKEVQVKDMPIRKFWRYVRRISKRDIFTILKTAESSGMVKFKQPIEYWMTQIDTDDKYKDVKTDADSIRSMMRG